MKKGETSSLNKIYDLLLKKAKGYYADEIIEEYGVEDGKEVLLKKKVTKKHIPPDLSASKLLLEFFANKQEVYENMNEEELNKEARRLIDEYNQMVKQDEVNSN